MSRKGGGGVDPLQGLSWIPGLAGHWVSVVFGCVRLWEVNKGQLSSRGRVPRETRWCEAKRAVCQQWQGSRGWQAGGVCFVASALLEN
jgi:hypothetical protein